MTPEPTPSVGTLPNGSVVVPSVVILTTAGLSLAATSMTADDSSIWTGCVLPVVVPVPVVVWTTVRSNAPARSRTATVPPDATTADSNDAATIVPSPGPPRRVARVGLTAYAGGGGVVVSDWAGWPQAPPGPGCPQPAGPRPGTPEGSDGAGSYHRSPAGCPPGAAHAQRASGRGSGVGA